MRQNDILYEKGVMYIMKPLKTKVSITLDSTVVEAIKELADNDDRSFSQFINLILKEYIQSEEKQDKQS